MIWTDNPTIWGEFDQSGKIEPQPFTSTTPQIGPLFARLRDIWASVAAKPYVGALNNQQNEFNKSFAEELKAIEERLHEFKAVWMRREKEERDLTWELRALHQELNKTHRLLASIESRLEE